MRFGYLPLHPSPSFAAKLFLSVRRLATPLATFDPLREARPLPFCVSRWGRRAGACGRLPAPSGAVGSVGGVG